MAPPNFWRGEEKPKIITPVVVKMPIPNYSLVEISSPGNEEEEDLSAISSPSARKGSREKNARQLTWVLLLRANRAAGFFISLAAAVRRRIAAGRTDAGDEECSEKDPRCRGKLYSCIFFFLVLSLAMLGFELAAYFNGWNLGLAFERAYAIWVTARKDYLAPPLQHLANICVVLFLIQSLDRLILSVGCFWIKLKKIKPVAGAGEGDPEAGEYFPRVLVQIPMCNEKEVYQQSIAAVCGLDWPSSELLIQVLDDSDEEMTRVLIEEEVKRWRSSGVNIVYRHREVREGYKAGNLKSAMDCSYVQGYEFVAIFDADFQPCPDFLKKTVPHFEGKERVGLVQARWSFVNRDENLLTRLQNVNLCFHFEVEQQVNGIFLDFFGFNGTAGVWRIKALQDAGGWMDRTTVEDMDIAVRAHLKGWKFIFLNNVECQCELPESYEAYRKQQHRWHSGPMQLFRLCLGDVLRSEIGFWKKSNLIFLFFLLRKLILPFYSFTLFCILLPMTMFVPEAELPTWVVCYVPATMSFLNGLPSPRSFPFIVPYLLFENTMSVTKFNAMISGLLRLEGAYEWVVTKKSGRSSDGDLLAVAELGFHKEQKRKKKKKKKRKHNRIYRKELALAFLLLTAAARSLLSAQGIHFYFLLFQGVSFLLVGLDLIGEQIE